MIKPEVSDFIGNELDKAKLEIASYWKDKYEKTQKALDIAVDALKIMNDGLPNGNRWKWEIEKALEQITATLEKQK